MMGTLMKVQMVKDSEDMTFSFNDREIGRLSGFELVTFNNDKSIRDAIKGMNGQSLDKRNIFINQAQSCNGGGGGGFSRGRGGGYEGGHCEGKGSCRGCLEGRCSGGHYGSRCDGGYGGGNVSDGN